MGLREQAQPGAVAVLGSQAGPHCHAWWEDKRQQILVETGEVQAGSDGEAFPHEDSHRVERSPTVSILAVSRISLDKVTWLGLTAHQELDYKPYVVFSTVHYCLILGFIWQLY